MPNLTLTSPTPVTRSGATKSWAGSSSGTYLPGDKSYYLRYQIVPDAPFTYLPTNVQLTIDATYAPTSNGTWIVDDTVSLGDASAPSGSNLAIDAAVSGARSYGFGTCFSNLATLNAGGYYLWIGYRADPTSTITGSLSVSPASPRTARGGLTVTDNPTFSITAISSSPYVVADVTVTTRGDGYGGGAPLYTGTTSVNNGVGASASGGIEAGGIGSDPEFRDAGPTTVRRMWLTAASTTVSPTGTTTLSMAGPGNVSEIVHTVTASLVAPTATTITINSLTMTSSAPSGGGGGFGGAITSGASGPIQDEQEMTTAYIDDVLTFWGQMTQYSTGTAIDATGSPAFRVYEESTHMAALDGSMSLDDAAGTDGFYYGQITLSAANGFEVGKCYCIRVSATVDSIAQGGIVERFVVRASPATAATNAAAVWAYALPSFLSTRATDVGNALAQVWRYLHNRNWVDNNAQTQTLYADDGTTAGMDAQISANSAGSNRGTMG